MKKIVAGVVAFAAACGLAFAADTGLSFENEISSDIVTIVHIKDGKGDEDLNETDFAGISEKMSAEYKSSKVDFGASAEFTIDDYLDDEYFDEHGSHDADSEGVQSVQWTDFDWYVEFRPIDILTIALHDKIYTDGSYLPVWDDNVVNGNLGSNGISAVFRPIQGLRLVGTVPFSYDLDGDGSEDGFNKYNMVSNNINPKKDVSGQRKFIFGLGGDYNYQDLFIVGANVRDVANEKYRTFGIYGSILAIDDLTINIGYTNAADYEDPVDPDKVIGTGVLDGLDFFDEVSLTYNHLITFGLTYEKDAVSLATDIAYTTDNRLGVYDLYLGASVGYNVSEQLSVGLKGLYFADLGNSDEDDYEKAKPVFGFEPSASFVINENNDLNVSAQLQFCDSDYTVSFPVSWVYHF